MASSAVTGVVDNKLSAPDWQRYIVNLIGTIFCLASGLYTAAWVCDLFPVASEMDAPPFARSFLWLSTAYHTQQWTDWKSSHGASPPPPHFH